MDLNDKESEFKGIDEGKIEHLSMRFAKVFFGDYLY